MGPEVERVLSAEDDVSEELREACGELGPSETSTERARGFKSWSTSTSGRQMAAECWGGACWQAGWGPEGEGKLQSWSTSGIWALKLRVVRDWLASDGIRAGLAHTAWLAEMTTIQANARRRCSCEAAAKAPSRRNESSWERAG